jgi:hypothetical protein
MEDPEIELFFHPGFLWPYGPLQLFSFQHVFCFWINISLWNDDQQTKKKMYPGYAEDSVTLFSFFKKTSDTQHPSKKPHK